MKLPIAAVATAAVITVRLLAAANGQVGDVKSVYIMSMSGGLDQYLALRLTTAGVVQIVTDPQKADAVLTDRIGASFDQAWETLYKAKPDKDADGKDDPFLLQRGVSQPLSRARGAFFLIDRKTKDVIWSLYARPKSSQPDELNHVADQVARELGKARKGK